MNKITKTILASAASAAVVAAVALPAAAGAQAVGAKDLFQGQASTDVANSLGVSSSNLTVTVARIIRSFLGLLGIVAVVIVVIGGFEWMTAGGNEEKVGQAKKRILQGTIGLALILSSFAIAQFIVGALVTATTNNAGSGTF